MWTEAVPSARCRDRPVLVLGGEPDPVCPIVVAFKHLAKTGFRPKGDLIYFGVTDEEAGGALGAKWMIDNNWDAVACDYMVTDPPGNRR